MKKNEYRCEKSCTYRFFIDYERISNGANRHPNPRVQHSYEVIVFFLLSLYSLYCVKDKV